jgi:glycopeptide antibiotics resistance protein
MDTRRAFSKRSEHQIGSTDYLHNTYRFQPCPFNCNDSPFCCYFHPGLLPFWHLAYIAEPDLISPEARRLILPLAPDPCPPSSRTMKRKPEILNFNFNNLTSVVFVLYAFILIKMILFKRPPSYYYNHFFYNYDWSMVKANWRRANLVPFKTILLFINSKLAMRDIVGNLLGNVLGFIPFGILVPMLFPPFANARRLLQSAFAISLLFELLQLVFVLGSFDVDDLLLNTIGAALGFLIYQADKQRAL